MPSSDFLPLAFCLCLGTLPIAATQPSNQFIIGDPTDEEQLHLELINRARANPTAEVVRLIDLSFSNDDVRNLFEVWQVDTNLFKAQFATNAPAAPLSFSSKLNETARAHSQHQLDTAQQTHIGAGGTSITQRAAAAGYQFANIGENVFAAATSPEQGHAAFDVDWGAGPGGMHMALEQRNAIHRAEFTEVGIGVAKGQKTVNGNTVGPQIVTQNFARPAEPVIYITGVAYYDINGNNFYDLGEGLPGVQVTVDGNSSFAITTRSGGYSVPVPANGAYTVRFNSNGRSQLIQTVTVGTSSVKLDFSPEYVRPIVTGANTAYVRIGSAYTVPALPDATAYRAQLTPLGPLAPEGFESTVMGPWQLTVTGDYPFISTAAKASGARSLHFGQMLVNGSIHPQRIRLMQPVFVGKNGQITFKSRLAIASPSQFAALEVSRDGGPTWHRVWSQNGGDVAGEETQFGGRSVNLAAFEGETVHIRFVFDAADGEVYHLDPTSSDFSRTGWYLDDVAFVNVQAAGTSTEVFLTTPSFVFKPTSPGKVALRFQPVVGTRTFAFGPAKEVTALASPPTLALFKGLILNPASIGIEFAISGTPGNLMLESAPKVDGPWSVVTDATLAYQGSNIYVLTTARTGGHSFFRVLSD